MGAFGSAASHAAGGFFYAVFGGCLPEVGVSAEAAGSAVMLAFIVQGNLGCMLA